MKKEKKNNKVDEATFKSFDRLDLSKIPGSATEILTTNWERFNSCRTYEDVVALCHELLDGKLDTKWSNIFFYRLGQIGENNPNPRRAFEQAMYYVSNARFKGAGLGMDRGTRRGGRGFYEGEDEMLNEGWIGGILGWFGAGILAGLSGFVGLPVLLLAGIGAYGGHKIQQYFENKQALTNLDDTQLALLAALAQAKEKGISKADIQKICDNDKSGKINKNDQIQALDDLVKMGVAVKKSDTYVITQNGRKTLTDAGFKQDKFDNDIKQIEKNIINESIDDNQKKNFQKKLHDGEVKFKYTKKDGSERTARGTLKPDLMDLPKKFEDKTATDVDKAGDTQQKKRKLPADSVFYYDLDAKGFRSFKMANFIDYI